MASSGMVLNRLIRTVDRGRRREAETDVTKAESIRAFSAGWTEITYGTPAWSHPAVAVSSH